MGDMNGLHLITENSQQSLPLYLMKMCKTAGNAFQWMIFYPYKSHVGKLHLSKVHR